MTLDSWTKNIFPKWNYDGPFFGVLILFCVKRFVWVLSNNILKDKGFDIKEITDCVKHRYFCINVIQLNMLIYLHVVRHIDSLAFWIHQINAIHLFKFILNESCWYCFTLLNWINTEQSTALNFIFWQILWIITKVYHKKSIVTLNLEGKKELEI